MAGRVSNNEAARINQINNAEQVSRTRQNNAPATAAHTTGQDLAAVTRTAVHDLKATGARVAFGLKNLPQVLDKAWDKLIDRAYQGAAGVTREAGNKLQVAENIAALGRGDTYKLALGADATVAIYKGAVKGEMSVERLGDGGFKVAVSGRLAGGVAAGLDKIFPNLKNSPISGDADALRGGGANFEFKFANAAEAKRAAALIAHSTREAAQFDKPISAADAKWLAQHIKSVEFRGELSAQVSAGLKKPDAKVFAGIYTKDKITQTDAARIEFDKGRPTAIVTRSELKGEGRLGLGIGFEAAKDKKGNTNSVLGGNGEVKINLERRYELPANLSVNTLERALENPQKTARALVGLVRNARDTVDLQVSGQSDAARNGAGGEIRLKMQGGADFYKNQQTLGKLFQGNLVGALRTLPTDANVELKLTPFERRGVFSNPSITIPGVKIGAEIESIRTDRKIERELNFKGTPQDAAAGLESFGKKLVGDLARLPFALPQVQFGQTSAQRQIAPNAPVQTAKAPTADELINNYGKFAKYRRLSDEEKAAIRGLNPLERQMYQATLGELAALEAGKVNAARYFVDILHKADQLSGGNREKFVNLVGMAFSASPTHGAEEVVRNYLGAGGNRAGSTLEGLQQKILSTQGLRASHAGFNPNVINSSRAIEDQVGRGIPTDTVTHHFREFFVGGYKTAGSFDPRRGAAFDTAITIDDGVPTTKGIRFNGLIPQLDQTGESAATRNEGDIRNGLFAAMVGQGLRDGRLTTGQAVELIKQAFVANSQAEPLWGRTAQNGTIQNPGSWTSKNSFDSLGDLQRWINDRR